MDDIEVPVLIVGAGPAGLAAGVTLAGHGVPLMLVERRAAPFGHPRATTVSTRTMELLRGWGLADAATAGGVDLDWLMWIAPTLAAADAGEAVELGLPTRAQARLVSPVVPGCIPQDHLETVMLHHLAASPLADVRRRTGLVALEARGDGVVATIRTGGRLARVRAAHLVAGDGARSAVRDHLGIAMEDHGGAPMAGVTALVRAPLWDLVGAHRYGIYLAAEGGETLLLPAGPGDRWGFGYVVAPGEEEAPTPDVATLTERLRAAAGVPDLPARITWTGTFASGAALATRFREGRVFLVGDAAHRVTPRGGTGMNTAVHDGFDIGWKLAWVHRGWAAEGLLDTYERERRPVAVHNVARSGDPMGSRRPAGEELRADLGGRIAHHWVDGDGGRASTIDMLAPGLTLFTGPGGSGWGDAGRGGDVVPPVTHRRLDDLTARALGIGPGGALLVRPDGVPQALRPDGVVATVPDLALAMAG